MPGRGSCWLTHEVAVVRHSGVLDPLAFRDSTSGSFSVLASRELRIGERPGWAMVKTHW